MENKHIFIFIGCVIFTAAVLGSLYTSSSLSKEPYRASFNRRLAPDSILKKEAVWDLGYNSFYIAAFDKEHLYLGNRIAPLRMLIVNLYLKDIQHVLLRIKSHEPIDYGSNLRLEIDSPYFYLTHGVMPALFRGTFGNWEADRFMSDSAYFVEAVPMGPASFALRSYSRMTKAYELGKETVGTSNLHFNNDLLEKQIDGLFCVDGTLHLNKHHKQLLYLYSYRNQYITIDTNLNLINRYHTIDTFTQARISVANIPSEDYSMLASPPTRINGNSSTSGNFLLVQSMLLAKNENHNKFKASSVIDVYNFTNGTYRGSFYLPDHQNLKPSSFKIHGDRLAVIFGSSLHLFRIDLKIFESTSYNDMKQVPLSQRN